MPANHSHPTRRYGRRARWADRDRSDGGENRCRAGYQPGAEVRVVGVQHCQSRRPEELEDVCAIGDQRVFEAQGQRDFGERCSCAGMLLHQQGDQRCRRRQREERELFKDQAARWRRLPTAERPVIQQQEREGQGDDHGLRHQPAGEGRQEPGVRCRAGALDVAQPRSDRQEPEQAAQHLAAFGDPRHRLHMQRMDGEEQRDEGAGPQRTGHAA